MSRGSLGSSSILRRSLPIRTSTLRSNGSKRRLARASSSASRLTTRPGRVTNTRSSANSPRVSEIASPDSRASVRASRSRTRPAKLTGADGGFKPSNSGTSRMASRPSPECEVITLLAVLFTSGLPCRRPPFTAIVQSLDLELSPEGGPCDVEIHQSNGQAILVVARVAARGRSRPRSERNACFDWTRLGGAAKPLRRWLRLLTEPIPVGGLPFLVAPAPRPPHERIQRPRMLPRGARMMQAHRVNNDHYCPFVRRKAA